MSSACQEAKIKAIIELTSWKTSQTRALRAAKKADAAVARASGRSGERRAAATRAPRKSAAISAPSAARDPRDLPDLPKDLRITHPERVIDPSTGLTKQDLVNYYLHAARRMLPHLHGRRLVRSSVIPRLRSGSLPAACGRTGRSARPRRWPRASPCLRGC